MAQTPGSVAPAPPTSGSGCELAAFGIVEATPDQLPTLRQNPRPGLGRPLPDNVLKYADDQTVVALAAVLQAVQADHLEEADFTSWAVVAAPRFLGRVAFAAAMDKFHGQGARKVSPLIIPFLSLHVVSGTVSLALQSHGPALGVGGGEGSLEEALLASLAVAAEHHPPGVWVVLSEWDPEAVADDQGQPAHPSLCRAVALAFVPTPTQRGLSLRWSPPATNNLLPSPPACPAPTLAGLAAFLAGRGGPTPVDRWLCPLSDGGWLELTDSQAVVMPARAGARPTLAA